MSAKIFDLTDDQISFNPCSIGIPLMSTHRGAITKKTSEFQSLFYWNTSDEIMASVTFPGKFSRFNPCSIGIPLMRLWRSGIRPCHLDSFNPCSIGIPLMRSRQMKLAHEIGCGFNPCSIGIPLMRALKALAPPKPVRFQSLFYWNTSDENRTAFYLAKKYRFQSLFYWNTSDEIYIH